MHSAIRPTLPSPCATRPCSAASMRGLDTTTVATAQGRSRALHRLVLQLQLQLLLC